MNLIARLAKKLLGANETDGPISAVLLLRAPRYLPAHELTQAAVRAFSESRNPYVVQEGKITFIVADSHKLNMLFTKVPYNIDDPPSPELWSQHRAWTAIDHLDRTMPMEERLGACSRMAAEIVDENCVAVYFPHSGRFYRNHPTLPAKLRFIS